MDNKTECDTNVTITTNIPNFLYKVAICLLVISVDINVILFFINHDTILTLTNDPKISELQKIIYTLCWCTVSVSVVGLLCSWISFILNKKLINVIKNLLLILATAAYIFIVIMKYSPIITELNKPLPDVVTLDSGYDSIASLYEISIIFIVFLNLIGLILILYKIQP